MASTTGLSEEFSRLSVGDSNEFPLRQISIDRDTFTDEDHKELDEETLIAFKSQRELNEEPSWPVLLCDLTTGDDRLVRLNVTKAGACLQDNSSILEILKKAWEKGTFKEIRQLGAFPSLSLICVR
jgi:hypothetical protein